jgi:peptidoglycan-associated lipoprotein
MTVSLLKLPTLTLMLVAALTAASCKKPPVAPPPAAANPITSPAPAPPAPAPTITLRATPATVERGNPITLEWEARNAASVTITPEIGNVPLTGNRAITPGSSVTYTATATGPGGTASDVARITVNVPAAPPATDSSPRPTVSATPLFNDTVQDIAFDYDKADIRDDMIPVLQKNASWLKANPNVRFTIEGHCDDRGSEEYNLGLGDRRANAVKEYLVAQGVPANRMTTISYGEERPVCRDETESCFERNRRAHFAETR